MIPTRILLVDAEPHARRVFRTALVTHGYDTEVAASGEEALEHLDKVAADLILLHVNTPGDGAVATCRSVRRRSEIPLIVVSVPPPDREKIEALDAGADDFLTKPFEMNELAARIRAVTRRSRPARTRVRLDDVEIDLQSRDVTRGGAEMHLSSKEFKLLDYLLSHADEVIPHRRLLEAVWGPEHTDEIEYLRVLINQLRKKIEPQPAKPKFILTEPHSGYRFRLTGPKTRHESPRVEA
jgi:two-component system KDP operon response regulator KdpE